MYEKLKKLKQIKGLVEDVQERIEKAWVWGLITDEQFKEMMEIPVDDTEEQVEEVVR